MRFTSCDAIPGLNLLRSFTLSAGICASWLRIFTENVRSTVGISKPALSSSAILRASASSIFPLRIFQKSVVPPPVTSVSINVIFELFSLLWRIGLGWFMSTRYMCSTSWSIFSRGISSSQPDPRIAIRLLLLSFSDEIIELPVLLR